MIRARCSGAAELSAQVIRDRKITAWNLDATLERIAAFTDAVDLVYLTVCLDVFPAAVMPAVSTPASRGVTARIV